MGDDARDEPHPLMTRTMRQVGSSVAIGWGMTWVTVATLASKGQRKSCRCAAVGYTTSSPTCVSLIIGSGSTLVGTTLGIGRIELEDGRVVNGFVCEPYGVVGCTDITSYGGWRVFRKATGI
jgi:hypothetical protein